VALAACALAASLLAAPIASAGSQAFPERLTQRYLKACKKTTGNAAFCQCLLGELEKRLTLREMVQYVVAIEKKRKPSPGIVRKVGNGARACVAQAA
jgi:hypothetical protein